MNKLVKAMLRSVISDIRSDDFIRQCQAEDFLTDDEIMGLFIASGCPETIIYALNDTLPLSHVERIHCCDRIWEEIKKIPAKGRLDRG